MKLTHTRLLAPAVLSLALILAFGGALQARAANVEVGQPAPEFQLPDETGHVRSLADYHGKILILAFYPKDFTGG